jgi:hypothetical protein
MKGVDIKRLSFSLRFESGFIMGNILASYF